MKKISLSFILLSSLALAKSVVTLMPYTSYIDYSSSVKNKANVVGIYSSYYNYPNKIELGLENINIEYKTGQPDLDQNDITLLYTRYFKKHFFLKGGVHYIKSDDKPTDHGLIGILGFNYYQYLKYNAGIDLYYSRYKHYQPKELKVLQVRPYIGFNFGNYYSKLGSFYLEAEYNYIKPDNHKELNLKSNYNSFGLKLSHYKGKWTQTLGAWVGKKAFAIDNGGFTVYNLGETYKAEAKASVDYAINLKTHVKVQYSYAKFDENGKKAHSNSIGAFLSHSW